MSELKFILASPQKVLVEINTLEVRIPTTLGIVGILPNHADLIGMVEIGVLSYVLSNSEYFFAITSGFFEVKNDVVTVLVSNAELAEHIDKERAEKSLKRAKERLELKKQTEEVDVKRALASEKRASVRLEACIRKQIIK